MRETEKDIYLKCDELRDEANEFYKLLGNKKEELNKLDQYYINDMNNYLNKYDRFKEHQIKNYINDLKEYIGNQEKQEEAILF